MKILVGANREDGMAGERFFLKDPDTERTMYLNDLEADQLLYWYVTKVLGLNHKPGYWELELPD